MGYHSEHGHLPVPSQLNNELAEYFDAIHSEINQRELPLNVYAPMIAHVSLPNTSDDLPSMFARATESQAGPLQVNETNRWFGEARSLCILPTPLEFGLRALALYTSKGNADHWYLRRLEIHTPDIQTFPRYDYRRSLFSGIISSHTMAVDYIPRMSPDDATQTAFKAATRKTIAEQPLTFDETDPMTPSIAQLETVDGNGRRGNYDLMTINTLMQAAKHTGTNPLIAKKAFVHLLGVIGGRERAQMNTADSGIAQQQLDAVINRIVRTPTQDYLYNQSQYLATVAIDTQTARDVVTEAIQNPQARLFTKSMLTILTSVFDGVE